MRIRREVIMADLTDQIALVTGASRGIGRAIAQRLAADGARVILHYSSSRAAAHALAEEIRASGGHADLVSADLAAADGPARVAAQIRALGIERLDIAVLNAGTAKAASIEDQTVEDFDFQFAVNVRAPFFLVQQVLPLLGDGARLVFVSSIVARSVSGAGLLAYSGTKGAIETLVRGFAAQLGPRGIRVNAVAPGAIETDLADFLQVPEIRQSVLDSQALKRIGQPDDIADVVAFLASNDARWITGRSIEASGGGRL
jgi:NAD(P)-dependent dehydrogenase (short-subunit alcohol dehydrogenase family)